MSRRIITDMVPVILAGGSGTRLWPASRAALPKHLADLFGDTSLLQSTALRITEHAHEDRLLTVAAASQAVLIRQQLEALRPGLGRHLVLEPEARNTAAAVAVATLQVSAVWGPDALLWICPSDHLMTEPEALHAAVEAGAVAARAGRLVTFGITATRPETGFGYIALGEPIESAPSVRQAARFVEKPSAEVAAAMLAEGGFVWNSGMFLFKASTMLAELALHAPDILAAVETAMGRVGDGAATLDPVGFAAVPSAPIDKAVMERSSRVAVVPCAPGWSDVGSWHAVWELARRDASGNALTGDALVVGGRNNLVRSDSRLVALAGVDDLAVIDTADALLVAPRGDSEAVKALVAELVAAERPEAVRHRREMLPWGSATLIAERPGYRLRELVIDPGAALEVTAEAARGVSWQVVEGTLTVEADGSAARHAVGSMARGEPEVPQRLSNAQASRLVLVEIKLA